MAIILLKKKRCNLQYTTHLSHLNAIKIVCTTSYKCRKTNQLLIFRVISHFPYKSAKGDRQCHLTDFWLSLCLLLIKHKESLTWQISLSHFTLQIIEIKKFKTGQIKFLSNIYKIFHLGKFFLLSSSRFKLLSEFLKTKFSNKFTISPHR